MPWISKQKWYSSPMLAFPNLGHKAIERRIDQKNLPGYYILINRVEDLSSNMKVVQYFFLPISLSATISHHSQENSKPTGQRGLLNTQKCLCTLEPPTNFPEVPT